MYERARPGYPREAIDWLLTAAGLEPGDTVLDLAAGTGKLTRLLVERGLRVIAVEPVDEMRRVLQRVVPEAEPRAGTAEAIPAEDGVAQAVTVAQAFHWFDVERALPAIARVLRPAGALVVLANVRDQAHPLQAAVEQLLAPYRAGYPSSADSDRTIGEHALFEASQTRAFRNDQLVDEETFIERVASVSWIASLQPAERENVLERARALVAGVERPIFLPYVTEVVVCRRR